MRISDWISDGCSSDLLVEAVRRAGVGAGDDQEVAAVPGLGRDPDLGRRLLDRDDLAAGGVAAFLREFLVLELDGGGAGNLVAARRVLAVPQPAVAGVTSDERRVVKEGFKTCGT